MTMNFKNTFLAQAEPGSTRTPLGLSHDYEFRPK